MKSAKKMQIFYVVVLSIVGILNNKAINRNLYSPKQQLM